MKDRKFEISIMIILFTFAVVVIGCYLIYGIILEKQSYTLFLKPYRVLKCKKWNCEDVSNDVNKYNNKESVAVYDINRSTGFESSVVSADDTESDE